jgi:two-component system, LytTR family, sensor kinase
MPTPWPVPIRSLVAGCAAYAVVVAALSWVFTLTTGLSRWTMTPAGPARWYGNLLLINVAQWCGWAALAALVFTFGRRVPFGRAQWRSALGAHVVASIVVATAHGVFVSTVRVVAQTWWGLEPAWWPSVTENFFRTIDSSVPIYWALLGLQHAVDYHREARAREVASARLETRLVEAQLQALHRQVHPHFLFNTLHAISTLLHRDPDKADRMIERLSDMLRVTLAAVGVQEVPLRQELDFLQAYLDIEQVNFGPRLRVELAIDPDALDALVPNLVLQPLAENALRHGLAPLAAGGTLRVGAHVDGETLLLVVRDDGLGPDRGSDRRAAVAGHGVGLANTRARLEALHHGAASLDVRARAGGGTEVTLRLPFSAPGAARRAQRAS